MKLVVPGLVVKRRRSCCSCGTYITRCIPRAWSRSKTCPCEVEKSSTNTPSTSGKVGKVAHAWLPVLPRTTREEAGQHRSTVWERINPTPLQMLLPSHGRFASTSGELATARGGVGSGTAAEGHRGGAAPGTGQAVCPPRQPSDLASSIRTRVCCTSAHSPSTRTWLGVAHATARTRHAPRIHPHPPRYSAPPIHSGPGVPGQSQDSAGH